MNRIQYRRWKAFAFRMVEIAPVRVRMKKEYQSAVIPAVEDFFERLGWWDSRTRIRVKSWEDTLSDNANCDRFGRAEIGPYVCDEVDDLLSDYNPYQDSDEKYDKAYEDWDERWGSRIRCALRAGLDLASEPSAGVWGILKREIEKMYPEGVPKWIRNCWDNWDSIPNETPLCTG